MPVADPTDRPNKTLIKLEGGHSTVVYGPTVSELAHDIQLAREESEHNPEMSLLFLESQQHGVNGLVIDPEKVVALIRA